MNTIYVLMIIIIGFGSLFAVIVFVYAGYLYLTPIAKNKLQGKTMITNVFVGILILSSIYLMLNTINPDLLNVEVDQGIVAQAISGTVDNFNENDVVLNNPNIRNNGRGYEMNGEYDNPKPSDQSFNLAKMKAELENGAHITKITADTTKKLLFVYLNTETTARMPFNVGAGGVAAEGQGIVGDKKTPKGSFVIGGDLKGGGKAAILVSKNQNKAILSGESANMGAAFLGINIEHNGTYRGIGIHGRGDNSLAATLGCIRVHNDDLLMFAPHVKEGIPIQII